MPADTTTQRGRLDYTTAPDGPQGQKGEIIMYRNAHVYFRDDGVFVAVCPHCGEPYKAALFLWESVNNECCGYECRTCGTRYILNY
jgi:hypothetical protein